MNVSLPKELKHWVDAQVEAGGYGTASEYIRDMLRRSRERQLRRQIDAKLLEAVEGGMVAVMDDADLAAIRNTARSGASKIGRKRK